LLDFAEKNNHTTRIRDHNDYENDEGNSNYDILNKLASKTF